MSTARAGAFYERFRRVGAEAARAMRSEESAHRPFVAASAETLPFADANLAGAWSSAVLEHVPDPARALQELTRVPQARPGRPARLLVRQQ